jgi:protein disulfide-isomerase-like protein
MRLLYSLFLVFYCAAAAAPAIELNDANFEDLVLKKKSEMWLVMFYAPWCGHCKHLKPIFDEAAPKARSYGMRMGKMDATANAIIPKQYDVKGYPTLLYYRKNEPQKYAAARDLEGFIEFAKVMKKSPVVDVKNQHSLDAMTKKRPVVYFILLCICTYIYIYMYLWHAT